MKKIFVVLAVLFLTVSVFSVAEAKTYKGEFRVGNGAEPASLDPQLIEGVPEARIMSTIFEGLTVWNPKDGTPLPGLAKSWDVSKDGKTYTFHLRQTTWSDGVPITADTIVKSWLRILDPKLAGPYAWFPAMFLAGADDYNAGKNTDPNSVKIKAIDKYTFQMEMVGPLPYVLGALAHHAFSVVPLHVIEKYGKDWTLPGNMVSNGAFVLEDWKPQQKLSCVPNPKYWDKDNVNLARVIFYPSDDINTVHKMYLNGEIDWSDNLIPLDQIEAVQQRADYQMGPALITYYYIFNQKKPPFNDVKVRKALSMAVNRKDLVKKVTKGGQLPTATVVPPMPGYPKLTGNMDNIELAKKMLAEAGFPNGKGFPKFELLYNTSEAHKKVAEYVQQQWKENLGIECTLANQEWKTYLANRNAGQFEVVRAGWAGDYLDPNTFLELFKSLTKTTGLPQWACGGCLNPDYDKLIEQAGGEMNAKKRMDLMGKAEDILVTADQSIAPLYVYVNQSMIDLKKWGGWYVNTLDVHPMKTVFVR